MASEFWRAIVLGLIQGVAEFLPVSSSGHLVVFGKLLEQAFTAQVSPEAELQLNVALHLGTLGSILVVFRHEVWKLPSRPRLCGLILLASIPAGLAGILLKRVLAEAFDSPLIVALGWLVTAGMLCFGQRYHRDERTLDTMTVRDALVPGLFQAVALVPGISRSGSTIAGGLISGLSRESAAAFSFLMAIPVLAGAALLELGPLVLDALRGQPFASGANLAPLLAGALTSFLVGIFSLKGLLNALRGRKLHWFAIYCVLAALIVLGVTLAGRRSDRPETEQPRSSAVTSAGHSHEG